jgi:serine/threonine protein kinase
MESSELPVVKVADFGLSKHKLNSSYVSSCRDLRGTLPYMAPELVSDPERVCEKADVWSLGVVMWEMMTRETPFQVGLVSSS